MSDANKKPVIFLAFANDRDDTVGYLRNLPEEARQIRQPIQRARRDGLCELVELANATADDVFRVFQDPEYRDRIAIFHYGGHANGYQLLLESADGSSAAANAGGLAAFLAQQQGLQLVFLNGCSTQQQVQGLLDANVSAVIATSRAIDDQTAMQFARQFYQGLAGGANLRTAYKEAEAAIQTSQGGNTRALYFDGQNANVQSTLDRWPWDLYLREGAEIVCGWSLPEAAGDPLFGLPPLPQQDLPATPFRHLSWFDREHAELFFGRGHQIRELYDLVTSATAAPIVLLYGQSGVGKSSMLAAGLVPRLEHSCEVRYLRRDQEIGLLESLRNTFIEFGGNRATSDTIHFAQDWLEVESQLGRPLVVIIDQVEEVFTRPNAEIPQEMGDFLNHLEATFGNRQRRPKGRLILGFRKEWLAEVEDRLLERKLPRAKVFLERLGRRGVLEAVLGPVRSQRLTDQYGLTIEEGLAEIITDDLLADRDSAIAPTLQILLTKMWTKATETDDRHPNFSQDLYQDLKREGVLLRDFLDQQIERVRERYPLAVDSGLLLDMLAMHTTPLGTADQWSEEQLLPAYAHLDQELPDLLRQCQDLHLLTIAVDARKEGSKTTRLAHDTLAPLVREQFDESDRPGQRARRILDNRSVDWEDDQEGTPLDPADLAMVEQGAVGTRALNSTEQRLLETSRRERDKRLRVQRTLQISGCFAVLLITVLAVVATLAKERAETSELAARESLDVAKTAVDEMLAKVGSESLKNVPQMEPIRAALLEKAADLYRQLSKHETASDVISREQAQSHYSLGEIYRIMDERTKATQEYQQAVDQFTALLELSGNQPQSRLDLAKTYNKFGWLLGTHSNGWEQAEKLYDKAMEQFEKIPGENAKQKLEYRAQQALTRNNRGALKLEMMYQAVEKGYEAEDGGNYELKLAMEKVVEARKAEAKTDFDAVMELLSTDQTDPALIAAPEWLLYLAYGYNNMAIIEDTVTGYKNAISRIESLCNAAPKDRELQLELAKCYNNASQAYFFQNGDDENADKYYQEAIQLIQRLGTPAPNVRNARGYLYLDRFTILQERNDRDGASKILAQARDIFEKLKDADPTNNDYVVGLRLVDEYQAEDTEPAEAD